MAHSHLFTFLSIVTLTFSQTPTPQQPCHTQSIVINETFLYNFDKLANQDCTLTLLSTENSSIALIIKAEDFDEDQDIFLYNQYGNRVNKKGNRMISFAMWPTPAVSVRIKTNTISNASLRLEAYPRSMKTDNTVHFNTLLEDPLITDLNSLTSYTKYVFTSDTHVVLSTVNYWDPFWVEYWINLYIYDGIGDDAPLVGTVYNTVNNTNFISSGNSLTIYCTFATYNKNWLIVNDYSNVEQFAEIKTWSSYPGNANSQVLMMDASKGPAALTVGDYGDYYKMLIKSISFTDGDGSMLVYNGAPVANPEQHMLATYNVANARSQLIFAEMTTFVLNKGTAAVYVTISQAETNWNMARVGRSGFISSPHYETMNEYQNVDSIYFGPENSKSNYNFTFQLVKGVSNPNATYSISVGKSNGVTTYNGLLNSNSNSISVVGQSVDLTIFAGQQNNTGVLVRFQMSKRSTTVYGSLLISFVFVASTYLIS